MFRDRGPRANRPASSGTPPAGSSERTRTARRSNALLPPADDDADASTPAPAPAAAATAAALEAATAETEATEEREGGAAAVETAGGDGGGDGVGNGGSSEEARATAGAGGPGGSQASAAGRSDAVNDVGAAAAAAAEGGGGDGGGSGGGAGGAASRAPQLLARSARPVVLPHTSWLIETCRKVLLAPLLVTGVMPETSYMEVRLFDGFVESRQHRLSRVRVALSSPAVTVHSATLWIDAQLSGPRYLMYHWFVTSFVLGVTYIALALLGAVVVVWLIMYLYSADIDGESAGAGDGDGDGDGDRSDVRMLVACNDKGVLKRAPQDVKKLLAARLDQLRRAADGALGSTSEGGDGGSGGGGGGRLVLGREGQPFEFETDAPCEVTFCAVDVVAGKLEGVRDFLASVAEA
mmetsp:Transcript_16151/g.56341  ORF Transcript_16151/g.56341 Transcript_16151/m.56341 type:complete len:408 (+) Transcript_16151:2177-3400(+)